MEIMLVLSGSHEVMMGVTNRDSKMGQVICVDDEFIMF